MKFLSKLLVVCAMVIAFAPASASADHPASAPIPRGVLPLGGEHQGRLRLAASAMAAYADGQTSDVWTVAFDGQFQLSKRIGVLAYVPIHRLDDGQTQYTGLGDMVLGMYGELINKPALTVTSGLNAHVPSGDRDQGLGQGVFAVSPVVQLSHQFAQQFNLYASGQFIVNLKDANQSGSALQQRANNELRLSFGGLYKRGRSQTAIAVRLQRPITNADLFATVAPSFGLAVNARIGIDVFVELPIHPTRRMDWRGGLAISYQFVRNRPEKPHTHTHTHTDAHTH